MTKRLTGKREYTLLHSAARESVVSGDGESELKEVLAKQNWNSTKAISKPFELLFCHRRIWLIKLEIAVIKYKLDKI
jgi:hypothetical protein